MPASLTLSHVTSNPSERLKITWTDTSNAAGVTYTAVLYEGSNKNGDMKQMRTGLTDKQLEFTVDLTPGGQYTVYLKAVAATDIESTDATDTTYTGMKSVINMYTFAIYIYIWIYI